MQRFIYYFLGALGVALVLPLAPHATQAASPEAQIAGGTATRVAYGQLPLSFEPNLGQADPAVRYLAHGRGFTLFLTTTGAVLASGPLAHAVHAAVPGQQAGPHLTQARGAPDLVHLTLAGASSRPIMEGRDRLPGTVNYFIGNNPQHWHTAIPTYARVVYRNVYPGIDQVWYGQGGRLEYDFVVRPGADPTAIRLQAPGAALTLGRAGSLAIHVAAGVLVQEAPRIYQYGPQGKRRIAGQYRLGGAGQVRLVVAPYVHRGFLLIDPVLSYSTYLGGTNDESGSGIAVDAQGDAYVTGSTASTDFPTTRGALQTGSDAGSAAFVSRLNPAGTASIYTTYLGGTGSSVGAHIALDGAGNAYVVGSTTGDDFPTTPGALQPTSAGGSDAFVAKLNRTGTALLYATLLGGKNDDHGSGIAVDGAGNAAVTGDTTSADFPTTPGVVQATYGGGGEPFGDAFVARLNGSGTALMYATFLGGSGNDSGTAVTVDADASVYVAGETSSSDFPTTSGAAQPVQAGSYNAFIAKLNGSGSALQYATYLGGSASDAATGIAVDASGSAYVTGTTSSADFPVTSGAVQTTKGGPAYPWDAFVAKLDPAGATFVYATFLGGSGDDHAYDIAVDDLGQAYVVGNTFSPDFLGTPAVKLAGGYDAFIAKLDVTGSTLLYGTYVGSPGSDGGFGIALDRADNAYITGNTDSSAFPLTAGGLQPQRSGGQDAFVARVVIPVQPLPALDPVSPPSGASTTVRYFPTTHHTVRGPFLAFYTRYGGGLIFGLPLSEAYLREARRCNTLSALDWCSTPDVSRSARWDSG